MELKINTINTIQWKNKYDKYDTMELKINIG